MRDDKNTISKMELKKAFRRVDKSNYMNFETLEETLLEQGFSSSLVFEIVNALESNYGFSCDSDLDDISEDEIDDLLESVEN